MAAPVCCSAQLARRNLPRRSVRGPADVPVGIGPQRVQRGTNGPRPEAAGELTGPHAVPGQWVRGPRREYLLPVRYVNMPVERPRRLLPDLVGRVVQVAGEHGLKV